MAHVLDLNQRDRVVVSLNTIEQVLDIVGLAQRVAGARDHEDGHACNLREVYLLQLNVLIAVAGLRFKRVLHL